MSTTLTVSRTDQSTPPTTALIQKLMPDKDSTEGDPFFVIFDECSKGLGIKIIGGIGEEDGDQDYGIFIRKVLPGGLADEHGVLLEGDQLLSVNGESLENITNEGAVELLRDASAANYVKLEVTRDETAKEEYDELLQAYSYSSASSVCDRTSLMSPMSQNNGWTSPISHTSCGTGTLTQSLRQRCEGSSSGSEHGSTLTSDLKQPPMTSHGLVHTPKIPNAAAASMQKQLLMAPHLSSTPQDDHGYRMRSKPGAPDGASGGTPDCATYQPSPVLPAEASASYTLPGASPNLPSTSTSYRTLSQSFPGTSRSYQTNPHMYPSTSQPRANMSHHAPGAASHDQDRSHDERHRDNSQSRRLSLDPFVRLKVSKLEMALKYLGIDPAPDDYAKLRKRLKVDENDMVTYKEFVEVARDMFKFQLEEKNFSTGAMMYALNDIQDFTQPPAFTPQINDFPDDNLTKENEDLRREVRRLKKLLRDKEDELIRIRQEAHGAVHESQSLRTKVHLVEQAQRAARNMEQDYEEVVRLLETENAQLRQQNAQQLEHPAIQKRMAVLGCQLRKSEVTKKTYEVATNKLLQFVERIHDTFAGQNDSSSRPESAVSQLSITHKKPGLRNVATEARDVVKSVRSLLEVEPLPFGWEESYTADGMKYYTNHVTQVTMWQHPLSNVQHTTPVRTINSASSNNTNNRALKPSKRKQLPSIPSTCKVSADQIREAAT